MLKIESGLSLAIRGYFLIFEYYDYEHYGHFNDSLRLY